jgi:hypothetical protein
LQLYERLKEGKMSIYDQKGGMFRAFHGIETVIEPADVKLYRSLLPQALSMPAQPTVHIYVISFERVAPWPFGPYMESSIALKSGYEGKEGWFVKTMPVTTWLANVGGRRVGFPKYVADEITLQTSPQCWVGEVKHKGVVQLRLEFKPELTRELTPWEQTAWQKNPFLGDGTYVLVPPDKGPTLNSVLLDEVVPPTWGPSEMGMVHVIINPTVSWAGLVPERESFPGMINHFKGGFNMVVKKLC